MVAAKEDTREYIDRDRTIYGTAQNGARHWVYKDKLMGDESFIIFAVIFIAI